MSVDDVPARPEAGSGQQSDLLPETRSALEPLRDALLAQARAKAERIRARAEDEAAAVLEDARAEVAELIAAARTRGEADARALLRLERARVQQSNRAIVLRAQREIYDDLVLRAEDAVRRLLADPVARERLAASLRDRLGPAVVITDTSDGGLQATLPDGRLVEASVAALVREALTRINLEDLWATAG
ncbi:V-type ATP synthase subunit E family protein [Nocardioides sp.]|uniref:V-type ATP synthase subunit E family protein n=1 Tax=Nocardioides sp. TaxID=35761 RepID=UPI003561E794